MFLRHRYLPISQQSVSGREERRKGGRGRVSPQGWVKDGRKRERKSERKKTGRNKEWSNLLLFPSGVSPVTCPKHIPVTHLSHIKHASHRATHTRAHTHTHTHTNDCALLKKAHWGAAHYNHSDLTLATEQLHRGRWGLLHIRTLKC